MLRTYQLNRLRGKVSNSTLIMIAAVMALTGLGPVLLQGSVSAAQVTSRSVTIASSEPDKTAVTYSFAFTTVTASTIQSMTYQFCDQPLGTCLLPGGAGAANKIDVAQVTAAAGAFTGTIATAFTDYTGANVAGCSDGSGASGVPTQFCVQRTEATSEAAGAKTFAITNISNPTIPSGNNEEIYVRIVTYSDTAFATSIDNGTVAASIVNQLTVTGRVQERLVFCMFALDDAAGSSATVGAAATNFPTSCSAAEATASSTVDIGIVDNVSISRSPVDNTATLLGNDRFGAAMINTNAALGVALTYYATPAATGTNHLTAFRVAGSTCNASASFLGDPCFSSANDATGTTLAIGTEMFGMQVVCVTNSNTTTAGTTANLGTGGNGSGSGGTFNTAYANGDTTQALIQDTVATDDCENTEVGNLVAWRVTGTAQPLISSTNVVDDEVVKLRFGAAAAAATPTGAYTVASTFIATPTF